MITLHHCMSARSFRILWMLEELGMEYDLVMHDFPPRHLEKDYKKTNPLGTVPAFYDDNTFMTESSAVCQYLADRYSANRMGVGVAEPSYGCYLNFLHFGEATLTFPQTLILRYKYFESLERRIEQVANDYERWFLSRLKFINDRLLSEDYICSGRFTAADVSVGYSLMLASYLDMEEKFGDGIKKYWDKLRSREAYMRSLKIQEREAKRQCVSLTASPRVR
ncbi:MAG: glutathione S-transferase family protein [Halomonas sp.]|uniref:glutathione S-transferase family protein n=1 Tax=Halomonas sp. TaxID=1486246 RepID=UPI003F9069AB